uniref:Eukaryotic translation initiation factor 3 30 kDa subunit n=1 Tax=Palpitomonas bilix TaxID=652834 RepID=A0A7S3D8J3_9EUKA|mmetsp:Transcript_26080/g.66186  ORF Transcript_26080/g.66186 Transcript_26080/m.66186 type:complete len:248 (+) Transcript_26080:69-812(+)|eukprot:CAMPEP_0113888942 /NCGR_PEP_ID=MMETSP0780_2-20120614/13179_1 /TAXON_ID=652834 /ORGANISM="Palpitomonas bilix" /LENGTH=247 /DNA_ID=CAMNT_0000877901 /DNA_START=69 /DNA_END=812 /DNA_ORIENTATION=+ /assembly_acc=CAM_ASM_000599
MDAWDAEDFEPTPMGSVPASWDDEEEEEEEEVKPVKAAKSKPVVAKAKPKAKPAPQSALPEDPMARKAAEQKAVEEADLELAKDLFGIVEEKKKEEQTSAVDDWDAVEEALPSRPAEPAKPEVIVYDPRKKPEGAEGATAFAERMRDCIFMYRQQQPNNVNKLFWDVLVESTADLTDQEMSTMAKYVATYKKKREKGEKTAAAKPAAVAAASAPPKVAKAVTKKKGGKGKKKFDDKPARKDDDFDFM